MTERRLDEEIDKWSEKLDRKLSKLEPITDEGDKMLENIKAYREDSEYFSENGKLVESFESLVWAWAYAEIGEDLNHLKEKE